MNSIGPITSFRPFSEYGSEEEFMEALEAFKTGEITEIEKGAPSLEHRQIYKDLPKNLSCHPEQFGLKHIFPTLLQIEQFTDVLLEELNVSCQDDRSRIVDLSNRFLGSLMSCLKLDSPIDIKNPSQVRKLFIISILQKQFLCSALKIANEIPDSGDLTVYKKKFLFVQQIQVESLSLFLSLPLISGLKSSEMQGVDELKRLALLSNLLLESSVAFFMSDLTLKEGMIPLMEELDPILYCFMEYVFPKADSSTYSITLERLSEQTWEQEDQENPVLRDALSLALRELSERSLEVRAMRESLVPAAEGGCTEPSLLLRRHLLPSFPEILNALKLEPDYFLSDQATQNGLILFYLDQRIQNCCLERLEEVFSNKSLGVSVSIETRRVCIHPDRMQLSHSEIVFNIQCSGKKLATFNVEYSPRKEKATVWKRV